MELAQGNATTEAGATHPLPPIEVRPSLLLNRKRAALYLETVYGARCSVSSLSKMAVAGTGPVYRKMGHYPVYDPADLDSWPDFTN
jgi:hypothetical protein